MSIRKTVRLAATGAFVLMFVPVVGDFFVEMARENGLYNRPTARVQAVVDWAQSIFGEQGFFCLLFALGGLAAGLWLDLILKRRESFGIDDPVARLTERLAYLLKFPSEPVSQGWGSLTPRGTTWLTEVIAVCFLLEKAGFRAPTVDTDATDPGAVNRNLGTIRQHWAHLFPLLEAGHIEEARAANAMVVAKLNGEIGPGDVPTVERPSLPKRLLAAMREPQPPPDTEPETQP